MMDGSFGYDFGGGMPKKLRNAKDEFTEWLCSRLDNVTIENRDALDVISTYDSPDTFHFVDPPYINSDCGHYEGTFDEYCMEKAPAAFGEGERQVHADNVSPANDRGIRKQKRMDNPPGRKNHQRIKDEPKKAGGVDGMQL